MALFFALIVCLLMHTSGYMIRHSQHHYKLADFIISWTEHHSTIFNTNMIAYSCKITHRKDPDHILFETEPFTSFISLGYSASPKDPIVDGNYKIDEYLLYRTPYQDITSTNIVNDTCDPASSQQSEDCNDHQFVVTGSIWGRAIRASYIMSFYIPRSQIDGPTVRLGTEHNGSSPENTRLHNQLAFHIKVKPLAGRFNRLFLSYRCENDEKLYGFGTQFSHFNLKNKRLVPVVVAEQGIGRGAEPLTSLLNLLGDGTGGHWHTSYAPKPLYVTNFNRAMLFTNSEVMFFDTKAADAITVSIWSDTLTGHILYGKSLPELVTEISAVTGRMAPLPDWTQNGAIVGLEGGTSHVETIVNKLMHRSSASKIGSLPIAAIWLQDWVGLHQSYDGDRLLWNWILDEDYYPNWLRMVSDWAKKGIRVMTYVNTFFSNPSRSGGQQITLTNSSGVCAKSIRRNLYQEGLDNGYFVMSGSAEGGVPYALNSGSISFHMLDLTNPAARTWMKDIIKYEMIAKSGTSGWMADFGEYLPFDAVLYDRGVDAAAYHNRYPEEWAKLNYDAIQEAEQEGLISPLNEEPDGPNKCLLNDDSILRLSRKASDVVYFMRSAWLQSPAYTTLFWLGDQLVNWDEHDGLKSAIVGALSSGLSGHSLTHSDIGGYTMQDLGPFPIKRSKELLFRWIELSAFGSAVFRTHVGSSIAPHHAQIYSDDESMDFFTRFTQVFVHLKCYRQKLMNEAAVHGWPLIRPMAFHYPTSMGMWDLTSQFMFGDAFLVAPVTRPSRAPDSWLSWIYTILGYNNSYDSSIGTPGDELDSSVSVIVAIPANINWVHVWSGVSVLGGPCGKNITVAAPLGEPPVLALEGNPYGLALRKWIIERGWQSAIPVDKVIEESPAFCVHNES